MAAVEVMTACENVCRDFVWLGSFSDWAPTLIGSATALVIAFVAYPWQKRLDRALQIELEQRAAYQELCALVYDLQRAISGIRVREIHADIDRCFEVKTELEREAVKASMLANLEVLNLVSGCIEAATESFKSLADELKERLGDRSEIEVGEVERLLEERKTALAVEMDNIFNRLLNGIRQDAFALPGEINIRSRRLIG